MTARARLTAQLCLPAAQLFLPATQLFLPAALPTVAAAATETGAGDERTSLEVLLRRERELRDAAAALLRPEVEARIATLDELERGAGDELERERLRGELVALGGEAAALLVAYLDPGVTAPVPSERATGPSRRRRAEVVRDALREMPLAAVTTALLELAASGDEWRRAGALAVLGHSTERDRVVPVLLANLRGEEPPEVRLAALHACARQGGEVELAAIAEALHDPADSLVAGALDALAAARSPGARSIVLALGKDAERARRFASGIVGYFQNLPELVDDEVVVMLLDLAALPATGDADRLLVLAAVPDFEPGWEPAFARALEPLSDLQEGEARDAALICLSRLGSTIARRDVLRTYDELVDQDPNWANAYVQRARVLMALEDYRLAIKDWKRALELSRAPVEQTKALWIDLARANALDGNLREAQRVLQDSPLTSAEIRALKHDAAFAEMAASARYAKLFE